MHANIFEYPFFFLLKFLLLKSNSVFPYFSRRKKYFSAKGYEEFIVADLSVEINKKDAQLSSQQLVERKCQRT